MTCSSEKSSAYLIDLQAPSASNINRCWAHDWAGYIGHEGPAVRVLRMDGAFLFGS